MTIVLFVHCLLIAACVSMKRLGDNIHFIKKCAGTRCKKKFSGLIINAKPDEIHTLSETAKNLLLGNVPLTSRQKAKLKRYKQKIKYLALKRNSISKKKRMLQRGGAFFVPLLAGLASSLFSLFGR